MLFYITSVTKNILVLLRCVCVVVVFLKLFFFLFRGKLFYQTSVLHRFSRVAYFLKSFWYCSAVLGGGVGEESLFVDFRRSFVNNREKPGEFTTIIFFFKHLFENYTIFIMA